MSALLVRKILRSMWTNRRSYLACIMVITIGVMMYIVMSNLADNMQRAVDTFYSEYHLADIFAKVNVMPRSSVEILERLDGIAQVQGRLVKDVRVNMASNDKAIILRLIGILPEEENRLNDYAYEGSPITDTGDILVGPEFLAAYDFQFGDTLEVIIDGALVTYTICGTAQSPEYVYMIPDSGTLYPDPAAFNIGFVDNTGLEKAANNTGFVNDIAIALNPGTRFRDIKDELQAALDPYGVLSLYERKDQLSYSMTDMEITGISAYATIFPLLFLGIAVVVLYIMLHRVVEQERVTIGTLKAFGYTDTRILAHYMLYGGITGLIGGTCGGLLGLPLADVYFTILMSFFNIPGIQGQVSPVYMIGGLVLAILASLLAAFFGVRGILRLRPAEAMRPEAPPAIRETWLDRSRAIKKILTSRGMMSLRYMLRNKLRSSFILVSISITCALMTVIFSMNLLMDQMLFSQFERAQTYNFQALLKKPVDYTDAVRAISNLRGVTVAEAIFEAPVVLTNSNVRKNVIITGLPSHSRLYFIIDQDYRSYPPPENGLILSQNMADQLGVKPGDVLEISGPLLIEKNAVTVVRTIIQPFGTGCFMELTALSRLLGLAPCATTVIFNADSSEAALVKADLLQANNVSTVEDKQHMLQTYQNMMGSFIYIFYFMGLMAIFIAFAVIYNITKVSLSERSRELATMRVLGLSIEETNEIITFEHWSLCLVAILIGLPLAVALRYVLAGAFPSDLFTIPTTTPNDAFILSTLGSMTSVWLANRSAKRAIAKFDLVEVLKERE